MLAAAALVVALVVMPGCARSDAKSSGGAKSAGGKAPSVLRLGYLPNLTHATALVGIGEGIFAREMGDRTRIEAIPFSAGPAAVEAIFSGALDAAYVGPNPAINAFARSGGRAIRIVSGATTGGAALVVSPAIPDVAALKGRKVASPQLGGTQDVALRWWLAQNGLKTEPQGGGDVSILPQDNSQTLETFRAGAIDGAWVPEPWATRLVTEGGGRVLVDERDLWPGGRFVTTHLIVRTELLRRSPATVSALLRGQVKANEAVNADPGEAQRVVNEGIAKVTGKKLDPALLSAAWDKMSFTDDPVAESLSTVARHAEKVGLLAKVDLKGIYDLRPLNSVLRDGGQKEVRGP